VSVPGDTNAFAVREEAAIDARSDAPLRCPACAAVLPARVALHGTDRLHGTRGAFGVAVCERCGSGLTLPVVDESSLGAFYPESYNAYALPPQRVLRAAATMLFRYRYWRAMRRAPLGALADLRPGRLLDVGGGRGDLGVVLRSSGWRVTSLDPSEAACREARERGVEAVTGTLRSASAQLAGPFDAVVFQHSLEHVVDPEASLRSARELVADDGLLIVTLPNFGSWQRRRFGADWFHLDLPRHRSHFTARGLGAALERAGFSDIDLSTSSSADGLPMSLQYRRLGRRLDSGALRYLAAAVSLATAPATAALNAATGGGDILHATAVRRGPAP
jgi:SAM-dependent methyltransferase